MIEWWGMVVELFLEMIFPSVELVRFIAKCVPSLAVTGGSF